MNEEKINQARPKIKAGNGRLKTMLAVKIVVKPYYLRCKLVSMSFRYHCR